VVSLEDEENKQINTAAPLRSLLVVNTHQALSVRLIHRQLKQEWGTVKPARADCTVYSTHTGCIKQNETVHHMNQPLLCRF